MSEQNYANHTRIVPLFHRVLFGLLLLVLIGSGVNLWRAVAHVSGRLSAVLILLLTVCVVITALCARMFALKAQDRAIRAEENFRHYLLAGKALDRRLGTLQVAALRFASDEEFPLLAAKAAEESLTPDAIKRSVTKWRADEWRV